MGNPRGFLEIERKEPGYRPAEERLKDYSEVEKRFTDDEIREQAARCMDCGIPFCHGCGCPLSNIIPEWNDLVYSGNWKDALEILTSTNNFPEFTGRICPAPCEAACTVGLNADPVTIRQIEVNIVEKGFKEGYIKPKTPKVRSGKRVAVVGSGPAGLAVADELNKKGHKVTVFERDKYAGGLLRYGIPDFKLDKSIVQRRVDLMSSEGVDFETGAEVGVDISAEDLQKRYDAICITTGARIPRDLPVEGRNLKGIHFAMDFLWQQNCSVAGQKFDNESIIATGKKVLVIGGGDTGSDCVGTSNRQGAQYVMQIEIMPEPPNERSVHTPWPMWPYEKRTSSSHKEGCERVWNVMTKGFEGSNGALSKVNLVRVEWEIDANGKPSSMREVSGSEFSVEADLVFLAMGFTGAEKGGLLEQLGVDFDQRGNVKTDSYHTTCQGIFAAGDVATGASLVVRAIAEGRNLAEEVDQYIESL